jgi:NAD(P)-dependent dehydrogenase (short-subunit alcohol dehydrogenase family)
MSDTSKTWLVTGTARGLGRFISEAVLAAGDRLVAGARDPERLVDLVERYGDRIRPVALDVTDEVAARNAVDPRSMPLAASTCWLTTPVMATPLRSSK